MIESFFTHLIPLQRWDPGERSILINLTYKVTKPNMTKSTTFVSKNSTFVTFLYKKQQFCPKRRFWRAKTGSEKLDRKLKGKRIASPDF
jgi:hypothetical protein